MFFSLKKKDTFSYIEEGEGKPIVLLHGLMGELSNFSSLTNFFAQRGYKVYAPELPLYSLPIISTNVANIAKHVAKFIEEIIQEPVILVGNSLGGHIGLVVSHKRPELVTALCLTGSSGLYEKSFGETYPKRGDYSYVERKTREVFFNPEVATKEIVDDVFNTVNDRNKAIKTLYIARDAIKSNMKEDLIDIKIPVCLIWGKQDNVTPPEVAIEFNEELPDASLYWIDECGHAPMMEHPDLFNEILNNWLIEKGINPSSN
ncbi:alpha/beta fold hydrolase [Faecalibacter bovis]|uniref:Alpha/beta hydrolase n=1 Tax=Faecalibacter bovis TaxID=2898187 RepID=A0ABX7XF66_9FLAO|nr:alpha/beta hydrolase [Faecalibacter bovis]MBS7333654.1 alpha/beta hydrolase [Weeksellaceae bacterium]QTV06244.1 alpha/beta hydrolase [Faecalibacter bovis]